MEDLEIRAAKAVGWAKTFYMTYTEKGSQEGEVSGFIDHKGNAVGLSYLCFTTSYDWAMLGVKECLKDPVLRQKFIRVLYMKTWLLDAELCVNYKEIWHLFELTPEQITQAWVEVLEEAVKSESDTL